MLKSPHFTGATQILHKMQFTFSHQILKRTFTFTRALLKKIKHKILIFISKFKFNQAIDTMYRYSALNVIFYEIFLSNTCKRENIEGKDNSAKK